MTELTAQQETELNAAIGRYRTSDRNPCGVSFYFDDGEIKPYRIADDHASESFATYAELLESAIAWKVSFDGDRVAELERISDWSTESDNHRTTDSYR